MILRSHDQDFFITVNGRDLMNSRQHESELELARLGCAHLVKRRKPPRILIGGLGMGYTVRATLDMFGPHAKVIVSELLGEVVKWNREFLGELNGHPLNDERVQIKQGDILKLIARSKGKFDAILLDVDNGPSPLTDSKNGRLYSADGIHACRNALREKGSLAIWSAEPSKKFERLLVYCGLQVRRYRVPAYKGSKSQSRFVWVASEDQSALPPGGGEPLPPSRIKKSRARGKKKPGDCRTRR